MKEQLKHVSQAFEGTSDGLDGIIEALRGHLPPEPPPPPPTNPKTVVTYSNGDIVEYEIEGELGENSIPDKVNVVKAEIGTDVTIIGANVFYNCAALTTITIPDSVTRIGNQAFYSCSSLMTITIPDNVTNIGSYVFYNCSALTSITISNSVTKIENNMFNGCSGLTTITIPTSVTSIDYSAFDKCSKLTSITIPAKVTSIGNHAFRGCNALSSITSLRTSAPTVQNYTFGMTSINYTGRNTYSTGNNVLKVPQGATGYNASYWLDPLQSASKCGFHIVYE